MGYKKEDVIKLACSQIGYLEKASNDMLDDFTANAGYNNFNKYSRDLDRVNAYNNPKNGYSWCTPFALWPFYKLYGIEKAMEMTCQPRGGLGAGCYYLVDYYKNAGRWSDTPQVGAQIFFYDYEWEPGHTGLVVEVGKDYIVTVEGNTSSDDGVVENGGCVAKKRYNRDYSRICGYGLPKYPEEEELEMTEETIEEIRNIVKQVLAEKDKNNSVIPDWAVESGEWERAIEEKMTDGTNPSKPATKAEVAAMILRTEDKIITAIKNAMEKA